MSKHYVLTVPDHNSLTLLVWRKVETFVNPFKREGDANDEIERSGKSVLQLAIEEKADRKTIESVIRSGADINLQDSFGNTPMISLTSVGMY